MKNSQLGTTAVCADCMMWSVNRDDTGCSEEWSAEKYSEGMDILAGYFGMPSGRYIALYPGDDEENESWITEFSRQHCELCNALPGTRYTMSVWSVQW